ncbi:MAG: LPS export ABC transporter periplasmic protein LptC, partial [Candidatus Coatesbacteria bacterium]|nr:LPS export ABC transporter periplasmic protein LptC [Candidatus Coatesbacteria bacterium]
KETEVHPQIRSDEYSGDAYIVKGFRRTVSEGAKTLYDLWAKKAIYRVDTGTNDASEKFHLLEDVLPASTYFGEGDERVSFSADEGRYDPESDNLVLRGNVMAMLETGLTLKCDEVRFSRSEMVASSDSLVVISGEGIHFQTRGFVADLVLKEVFFPSRIYLTGNSTPTRLLNLLSNDDAPSGSGEALEDGFYLTADQMLFGAKTRVAELNGDISIESGDYEVHAEQLKLGWKEEPREIEWGELHGLVLVKTADGSIGCDYAEYKEGLLRLKGMPLFIRDFDRLEGLFEDDCSKGTSEPHWATIFSSLMSEKEADGEVSFYGTRARFFMFRSAASYLGCTTLSGREFRFEEEPGRLHVIDDVDLTLSDIPGIADSSSERSVHITSDSLDYDTKAKGALFTGDVNVRSLSDSIDSDTLFIKLADSGDEGVQVESLEFDGSVEALLSIPSDSPESDGEPRIAYLSSDRLTIDTATREAVCSSNVSMHSEDRSLSCDELRLTMSEGMSDVEELVASGEVVLESEGRIATGGKLVYDVNRETAELTRQPKVWYGENVMLGRKVVYDLKTGNLGLVDSVRGVFYNEKELELGSMGDDAGGNDNRDGSEFSLSDSIRRPGKVELSADKLDYNDETMEGTYSGNVVVRKGDAIFNADSVRMVGDAATGEVQTLEAIGDVRVQDGNRVLRADRATYYESDQKVVLDGSPKIYEFGKIITRGAVVTLHLGSKEYEIQGDDDARIKTTLFVPEKDK